jgi:hypothetical protein
LLDQSIALLEFAVGIRGEAAAERSTVQIGLDRRRQRVALGPERREAGHEAE